jgi:carbamoyl-phosphate synthase small subunit
LKAFLLLEDGSIIKGIGFGAQKTVFGELVFNTGMTGYQETLTDPSYKGQILLMTYPLIGNYGCVLDSSTYLWQSDKIQAEGFAVSEYCQIPYQYNNNDLTLDKFLKMQGVPGISNIDTRELTMKIRKHGTIKSILAVCESEESIDINKLLKEVRTKPSPDTTNLVAEVTTVKPEVKLPDSANTNSKHAKLKIALIDCGVKRSIVRELLRRNCEVHCLPYKATNTEIDTLKPDGVVISNGPGDPAHPDIKKFTVSTIKNIVNKYPVWGICLGHQILSLAFGAKTYKLKFGHRGVNQPVKNLQTNKLYVTSQNHGFAVASESCPPEIEITEININDGTVEAMRHRTLPVYSVQYHPEASPGPHDSNNFFDNFTNVCRNFKETPIKNA